MAFLRLPDEAKKGATPATQTPRAVPRAVPRPTAKPGPGPTTVIEGPKRRMIGLGAVRVGRLYTGLGVLFAVLFAIASYIVFKDNREATYGTSYLSTPAQMRMLTQRSAKAPQTGLTGSAQASNHRHASRHGVI